MVSKIILLSECVIGILKYKDALIYFYLAFFHLDKENCFFQLLSSHPSVFPWKIKSCLLNYMYHDRKWTSFPLIWNSKISWSFNRRYWMSCFHLLKKALNLVISHRFLFVFFLFENLQNVPRYWSNSVPKQLCSLLTTFVLIYFS